MPLPPLCTSAESGRQGQNAQDRCFDRQTHAVTLFPHSSTRVKSLGLVDKTDVLYITYVFQFSVQNQPILLLVQGWLLAHDPHDSEQIWWDKQV